MSGIVKFDYDGWVARYPEFAGVSKATAEVYFTEASVYHANDGTGPVVDDGQQLVLLNMVVAHIAARYAVLNGVIPPHLVGRISSATEGSVSVSADFQTPPGTAQWWMTTIYGSDYWFATAPYRTMRYRATPRRLFDPWASFFGRRF